MRIDSLLPVLRNLGTDVLSQIGVYRLVVRGLAVFLAEVTPTPTGRLHVEYILRTQSPEKVGTDDQLFEAAFKNLIKGLRADAFNLGKGLCFRVHRPGAFGAAAIALPDFFESAFSWCESEELFVFVEDANQAWSDSRTAQWGVTSCRRHGHGHLPRTQSISIRSALLCVGQVSNALNSSE